MKLEDIKNLKQGQAVYFKIYKEPFYEEMTIQDVMDNSISFTDNTYCPEKDLEYVFKTKLECLKSCKKDLNARVKLLNTLIKEEGK